MTINEMRKKSEKLLAQLQSGVEFDRDKIIILLLKQQIEIMRELDDDYIPSNNNSTDFLKNMFNFK